MTRKDFKTNDDFKGSAIYLVRDIAIRIRSSPVYLTMEHGMKFRKDSLVVNQQCIRFGRTQTDQSASAFKQKYGQNELVCNIFFKRQTIFLYYISMI